MDFAWAAMGGGQARRIDWGYSGAGDVAQLKVQIVSLAHTMALGGSDAVMHLWRQHLEQQHHLLHVRRSFMASPPAALSPSSLSPSKFNFVPKPHFVSSPSGHHRHELPTFSMPELLQVRLCSRYDLCHAALLCCVATRFFSVLYRISFFTTAVFLMQRRCS